jgi:hypothetical protein
MAKSTALRVSGTVALEPENVPLGLEGTTEATGAIFHVRFKGQAWHLSPPLQKVGHSGRRRFWQEGAFNRWENFVSHGVMHVRFSKIGGARKTNKKRNLPGAGTPSSPSPKQSLLMPIDMAQYQYVRPAPRAA